MPAFAQQTSRRRRTPIVGHSICASAATLLSIVLLTSPLVVAQTRHAQPATPPQSNPIIPGDHPDPTIIRVGTTYWMTSTSGGWAPQFVIYRSPDLRRWTATGAVFPHTPAWATGDFWAPEMVADRGRVLVYYVARKRGGPLCIAAATAAAPQGPFVDHGPLLCQPDGSIDPSFVRDENGKPFLIWKEDGNSIGKPTPIYAQPLTDDLLHLTGEKTQLITNDPGTWEGGVVEAPYVLRHGGRFYLLYAGNACCGLQCNYAEGVARADHLFGPWEKDPANPFIRANGNWKCPGHGTAVQTSHHEDYFLYHAYPVNGTVYLGRESVLDRITWNPNGWPEVNAGRGPGGTVASPTPVAFSDEFSSGHLDPEWRWPIGGEPDAKVSGSRLTLTVPGPRDHVFIARSPLSAAYTASVNVLPGASAAPALAVIGNAENECMLLLQGRHLELRRLAKDDKHVLWRSDDLPPNPVWLRFQVDKQTRATFSYSLDRKNWISAGSPVTLVGLPPWDQGLRVGLVAVGAPGSSASFAHFLLGAEDK